MNPRINEFIKAVQNVSRSRRPYETFRDFVELTAVRISNSVDPVHFKQRNGNALQTQKKYSDDENNRMHAAFTLLWKIISENLERGEFEDVLGRAFEQLCIKVNGQDFTPDCVSRLAAALAFPKEITLPERGYITLSEPTCGSGSMILAAAGQLMSSGISCFNQFVVHAVDIEIRAVHMAYIQLSLYGIPAIVAHGNTITCEEHNRWYTPMYIQGKWVWKEPLGFTDGRHADDELLKLMTEPMYAAMQSAETLIMQGHKQHGEVSE